MKYKKLQEIIERAKLPGKWMYITPVSGVILTRELNNEFQINNVKLINRSKAKRKITELSGKDNFNKNKKIYEEFLNSSDVFALTWYSGPPDQVRITCRKLARNELAILALSYLGYSRRKLGPYPNLLGEGYTRRVQELLLETNKNRSFASSQLTGNLSGVVLSGHWKNFQKSGYFIDLLNILRGRRKVSRDWKEDLEKASIFAGQSRSFNEPSQSFLWNMIALESLFNVGNDKFSKEFPKRAEAFLGWTGFWSEENYAKKITEIYNKRCDLVHNGKKDHITIEDLLFTDKLVFNLMLNIVKHSKIFFNKKSIIEFSKKIEAEHTLGIRSKIRPKTFQFIDMKYFEDDFKEI